MIQYTWYFNDDESKSCKWAHRSAYSCGIAIVKFNANQNKTGLIASPGDIFNTEEEVRHDIMQWVSKIIVEDIRR